MGRRDCALSETKITAADRANLAEMDDRLQRLLEEPNAGLEKLGSVSVG
jgi:hypothetical protein